MDKKVTKKTIWPQFRITAFTKSDEGIEGAEGLGLLLSKSVKVASPLISFWLDPRLRGDDSGGFLIL
jgi:hypothetical protein